MSAVKLFDKAYKNYMQDKTSKNEKYYWKRRNKLVLEFQYKQDLEEYKEYKKDNEIRYIFGQDKFNVPSFTFGLIYNDLSHNVPKGLVFDYLDYSLEKGNDAIPYVDWYYQYGEEIIKKLLQEKQNELFEKSFEDRQEILIKRNEIIELELTLNKLRVKK